MNGQSHPNQAFHLFCVTHLEPVHHISSNNTAVTEIGYWDSALPGVQLGLLRLDFGVLSTWLQICGSYGHSTKSQRPYLTHEVSPYSRVRPTPQAP